jgi:quaternary ammonium compound-resistance protein SugE
MLSRITGIFAGRPLNLETSAGSSRRRRLRNAKRKATGTTEVPTAWLALFLAGLLEIGWALGLKLSDGLTRFWPTVTTIIAIVLSFALMGISLRSLPLGTAYAVWTGIGAAGTMVAGMAFGEPATLFRLFCLGLIVAGMVGLKLASP